MNRFEFYSKVDEYNNLSHYGTKGQKWGIRHWQNEDGTFNQAGKERYFNKSDKKSEKKEENKKNWNDRAEDYSIRLQKAKTYKDINKIEEEVLNDEYIKKHYDKIQKIYNETGDWDKCSEYIKKTPIQKEDWIYDIVEEHITKDQKFGGFKKTPEEKEMKKARKSLSKKDIDIDDSEVQDRDKLDKSIKSLSNDYEKHNKIVIDKLADMYYKAYQKTYGYEEDPISKAEFKETFENISGILRPNGILEGYTESDVNDSFSNGYYFNYDVLNKIVSDIESD